jgi:hypothetical protein
MITQVLVQPCACQRGLRNQRIEYDTQSSNVTTRNPNPPECVRMATYVAYRVDAISGSGLTGRKSRFSRRKKQREARSGRLGDRSDRDQVKVRVSEQECPVHIT